MMELSLPSRCACDEDESSGDVVVDFGHGDVNVQAILVLQLGGGRLIGRL